MITLKKLIALSSLSGNETAIQTYIATELASYGLAPIWVNSNLVFHIGGKQSNKAMLFNAHVDTVPAGDISQWKHHPLKPWVEEGKIFGLGASDEKAGVAALMLMAQKLVKKTPPCDVWLMFVTKEEIDGSGTQEVLEWWQQNQASTYSSQSAVLVEPTGLTEIEIGHKGNVFIKLTVKGDSGHGSRPHHIHTHAVMVMAEALLSLPKLSKVWQDKYNDSLLGIPTMAIGTSIQAGDIKGPNKFADTCIATLDIRTTPALHENVIQELDAFFNNPQIQVEFLSAPAPWGLTKKNDAVVMATRSVVPQANVVISPGATDQCFFTQVSIPAVVLGPGESTCMHQPNEYCYPEKITKSVSLYQQIIQTWSQLVK